VESLAASVESRTRAADASVTLSFQPIADLSASRAYAYEAILRGANGEDAGTIFSKLADDARAAFDRRASVAAIRWAAAAGLAKSGARLCIPIHAQAIEAPAEHIAPVLRAARDCAIIPERLIFALLDYRDVSGPRLAEIVDVYRKLGSLVAFVGLGPGQEGLGACGRYAPDLVKLEPELVVGIASSWSRRILLEELMPRLRSLCLKPVATGVDDEAVFHKLASFGINLAQGSRIAAPEVGALPAPLLRSAA
jgi:EAL domain-containing protein (putative c-di-GMP-specific phosphodiesterase class I)